MPLTAVLPASSTVVGVSALSEPPPMSAWLGGMPAGATDRFIRVGGLSDCPGLTALERRSSAPGCIGSIRFPISSSVAVSFPDGLSTASVSAPGANRATHLGSPCGPSRRCDAVFWRANHTNRPYRNRSMHVCGSDFEIDPGLSPVTLALRARLFWPVAPLREVDAGRRLVPGSLQPQRHGGGSRTSRWYRCRTRPPGLPVAPRRAPGSLPARGP